MKKMMRIASVLLIVALCCVVFAATAMASGDVLTVEWTVINNGTQIQATVNIPADTSIVAAAAKLTYNNAKLSVSNVTSAGLYNDTGSAVACNFSTPIATNVSVLCTVVFDIKDGATITSSDYGVDTAFRHYYATSASNRIMGIESGVLSCSHYADAGVVTEPTCSDGGYTTYTCTVCGHSYKGNEVAAKGHNIKSYPAAESTCTTKGHAAYEECLNGCGYSTYAGELPLAEHSYGAVTFTWKDDNSAVYSAECGKCDHSETGDAEVESNYTAATKCGEYGSTVYTANVDTVDERGTVITGSDTKTVKDAEPLAHDLKDVAAKAATCTEDGYTAHKDCSRCDYTVGKTVVGATGHDYDVSFTWASDGTSATYAAVCKKDNEHKLNGDATVKQTAGDDGDCKTLGSYTYTASVTIDSETYTDTKTVNGVYGKHDTEKVPAVTATCVKDGNVEHWHCDVCGKNFEEEACINELTEDEVVVEMGSNKNHPGLKTVLAVEPNCVEGGNIAYWYCPTCDTYFADTYLENEITEADTKLEKDPTAHKDLKHFDAVAATCAATGHKEYWYCSACEAYYDKADGVAAVEAETLVTEKNAANHSELVFVPKAEGDCQTEGNIAYIYCKGCGLYWEAPEGFKAEDLTDEFDPANLTVIEDGLEGTKVSGNPDIHNKNCYGKNADGHWTTCGTENGDVEEHLMNVETIGGKKVSTCAVCGYQTIENISTGTTTGTTSPKAGDEANIALWTVMVLGCGAGAALLTRKKKEN